MSIAISDDDRDVVLPNARVFTPRRGRWTLVLGVLALFPIALLVRQSWRTEVMLEAASQSADRVVVHELRPGQSLRVQLASDTEAVRFVMHAFGGPELASSVHVADVGVKVDASTGSREEHLSLPLPGTRERATAEEPELAVGDPFGSSIDLAGVTARELTLTLRSVDGATGVLVRVLRRDPVPAHDRRRRAAQLDEAELGRAAARAWETSYGDLSASERDLLVGFRWRNVAPAGGAGRSHALAIAPAPPREARLDAPLVWRSTVKGAERASFVASRDVTLFVSAADDVVLDAHVRSSAGDARSREAVRDLVVELAAGTSVEIGARAQATVSVRAADPTALEARPAALVWRIGPGRPALVTATADPILLRVTARAPLARTVESAAEPLTLVRLRCAVGDRRFVYEARVARSLLDRFAGADPEASPSEATTFHLVVPAGATAELDSDEPLDLLLAELDPNAAPRPIGWPAGAPPSMHVRGAVSWQGFVPRRPTNAGALETRLFHLGRVVEPITPRELPRTVRIRRPRHLPASAVDGETFVEGRTIELDVVTTGVPLSIPVHVKASAPVRVSVVPNATAPRAAKGPLRRAGLVSWVTVPRELRGTDTRAVVVVGDDLAPGQKRVRFESDAPFSLHVPWEHRPAAPHWSEGDYEP